MSAQLKNKVAHEKLVRFMTYMLSLESQELHDVMEHLPPEFEKIEKETICDFIRKVCMPKKCCLC